MLSLLTNCFFYLPLKQLSLKNANSLVEEIYIACFVRVKAIVRGMTIIITLPPSPLIYNKTISNHFLPLSLTRILCHKMTSLLSK